MLRVLATALALVALVTPTAIPAAAVSPIGASGGLAVAHGTYSAHLTWPAELGIADPAATLALDVGGRTAVMTFEAIHVSDIFLAVDTGARPVLVSATTTLGEEPRVALVYDFAASGAVAETLSTLTFTFGEDFIGYDATLRAPNGAYASYMELRTSLAWSSSWDSQGVFLRNGTLVAGDDGTALSSYQEWENATRYGMYLEEDGSAFAQARVAQGTMVNYLADGEWRLDPDGMGTKTVFNTFLDAPTASVVGDLWTRDALLFGGDVEALVDRWEDLGDLPTIPAIPSRASTDAQVVIALGDTGINPYHVAFRDNSPLGYAHPSTYIPGYPADAIAVELTLDAPTLDDALAADRQTWAALDPDTLYWFPGTKIVGGISMEPSVTEDPGRVFSTGHGTMTSSRAAANEYSLCPECRVVMMQAGEILDDGSSAAYIRWAAEQPWIDVQSHSWSGVVPFQNEIEVPHVRDAMEFAAARMPVYSSAGNGAGGKAGVLGHPAFTRPMSGAEGVIPVGGHDNGYVTAWTAQYPYVAADACQSWAAVGTTHDTFDPEEGGGTSAATPYAAGEAGRIILEARRVLGGTGDRSVGVLAEGAPRPDLGTSPLSDGAFTLEELKSVQFRTATARPAFTRDDGVTCIGPLYAPSNTLPFAWTEYPADTSAYPFIGWGGIDVHALDRALGVLHGSPMPVRPVDEDAHAQAEALRAAYRAVEPDTPAVDELPLPDLPPLPALPQDDAGSGGDAPDELSDDIVVESGVAYGGTVDVLHEFSDWYAFSGARRDNVTLVVRGVSPCIAIYTPNGTQMKHVCALESLPDAEVRLDVRLASTGLHYFYVQATNRYAFSVGVNELPAAIEMPAPGA